MKSPCCSSCFQRLDNEPKWRLSDSPKLLCDNCASKLDKASMTKQFYWDKCVSCWKAFPDRYYNCHVVTLTNKDGPPPSVIGHACCARCLGGWNTRRKSSFLACPICRGRVGRLVEAKVCTLDEPARPKDSPVGLPQNNPVGRYVVRDVLGVRLGRSEFDRKVRIRWEDTWERSDLTDRRKQVKCIVGRKPGFDKVRWKDTWEPLEYMDNGMLKEKAIELLEDKYGS